MVTPDKDFGQLVTERIHMYRPGRKGNDVEILDVPAILKKWGITRVDQVIDMLGLCGDSVDNIPGVPGIGPKTAQKLLAQFDSVEGILENTDQLKGKQQEKLRDHAEQARLSKTLATIQLDVPILVQLETLRLHAPDREKLQPLLDEFELRTLGKRIFGEEFSLQSQSSPRCQRIHRSNRTPPRRPIQNPRRLLHRLPHRRHCRDPPSPRPRTPQRRNLRPRHRDHRPQPPPRTTRRHRLLHTSPHRLVGTRQPPSTQHPPTHPSRPQTQQNRSQPQI